MTRLIKEGDDNLHERINRLRDDNERKVASLRDEISTFKLEVAREYASQSHLKEVEERLTRAIEKFESRMATMPEELAKEIVQAIRSGGELG